MIAEIATALSGLKAATDITSLVLKMKLDTAVTEQAIQSQSAIIAAQSAMLSLQSNYQELLDTNQQLKKQLTEVENWRAETEKYQLTEIAPSVFVYASKPDPDSDTPTHWLCSNCFQQKKKSILQREGQSPRGIHYRCPLCKFETVDTNHPGPQSRIRRA